MVDIVGRFARVTSDQYEEYGLAKYDLVFVAGSGFSPVDDDDNYKLLFVVASVGVDGVPSQERGVTIARKSLDITSDDENTELLKKMEDALVQRQEETKAE